ncbi:FAD/NAD(P)-binding domain-containing protein [Wilcoxina mikolae CBS 423.85]|nr:FAD/NAD(P)-binding domain-containing protein [Wilcoxina mikolae CBS 423.85]
MSSKSTLLVSGAGVAGPILALHLLSHPVLASRFHPILIDRLPLPPSPDTFTTTNASYATGAGVVLSCNAIHTLHSLGLKDAFNKISAEGLTNEIWRADKSDQSLPARYLNRLVSPAWAEDVDTGLRSVERGWLQSLLVHTYLSLGGEARWDVKVSGVEQTLTGVSVSLSSGDKIEADIVVGADGTWSAVRKALLPEDRWKPEFQYSSGIFGIASRPEGKEDDAVVGRGHVVLATSGCCSTWVLPDGRQFFTLHDNETTEPAPKSETVSLEGEGYKASLTTGGYSVESSVALLKKYESVWHPVTGTFGSVFKDAERIGRVALWHRVWEEHEIQGHGNIVLVGDAGRCMIPAAGQGACFAIEDATVLADALLNNPATIDDAGKKSFDAALKSYAAQRVPRSKRIARQSYWSFVVMMMDRWWLTWLRDWAIAKFKMDVDARE